MNKQINITELVCTRISHDLIGNIGAFANAVELLEDGDEDFMPEIQSMLKNSSFVLNARMKFFRMTFGLTNANLEHPEIVQKTCIDYIKTLNPNHPVELKMNPIANQAALNRALMLAVMVAADVIVKGGTVTIQADSKKITAYAQSNFPLSQTKIEGIKSVLNGELPEGLPQYAPLFCLREMGGTLELNTDNGFVLSIG